ncbi:hypothetical protein PIIN_03834 [Serendipita indica DSM 11827]|uniref:Transmembrane protein 19 n=1 Tax=Serendipita indica (strain DSM 11827) TaxID=1109443 RepID=G4TF07_SERID|nr:hypothetical protein PIIN_03834 [Serendipita indica DSM 11827]
MDSLQELPVFSLLISAIVTWKGLKDGKLSFDGAVAAFFVGFAMLSTPLHVFGITLLVLYFVGSRATRVGKAHKVKMEEGAKVGLGARDAVQACLATPPAFIACLLWRARFTDSRLSAFIGVQQSKPYNSNTTCAIDPTYGDRVSYALVLAALGQFGCSLGDTLASELGILSKSKPILVTTLKKVPPGTNGAMSVLGTAVSVGGGGLIGLTMSLVLLVDNPACRDLGYIPFLKLCLLGIFAGGFGSLLDSFLGATVQQTLYSTKTERILTEDGETKPGSSVKVISGRNLLSNNQVNLVSAIVTTLVVAYIG